MTKQHIDRLKELLLASKDLTEPMDYFLRKHSPNPVMMRDKQRS